MTFDQNYRTSPLQAVEADTTEMAAHINSLFVFAAIVPNIPTSELIVSQD